MYQIKSGGESMRIDELTTIELKELASLIAGREGGYDILQGLYARINIELRRRRVDGEPHQKKLF